jgi:hypothetical protein
MSNSQSSIRRDRNLVADRSYCSGGLSDQVASAALHARSTEASPLDAPFDESFDYFLSTSPSDVACSESITATVDWLCQSRRTQQYWDR